MKRPEMPVTVQVGVHRYSIVRPAGLPDMGKCKFDQLTIYVRPRLKLTIAQGTLLHEILHACHPKATEDCIEALEENLLFVIQNNPELIAYLTEKP